MGHNNTSGAEKSSGIGSKLKSSTALNRSTCDVYVISVFIQTVHPKDFSPNC